MQHALPRLATALLLLAPAAAGCRAPRVAPIAPSPTVAERSWPTESPLPPGSPASAGPWYVVDCQVRVGRGTEARVLTAPRLVVKPAQRANVSVLDQTSFVQTFETQITEGAAIADPVIGILQAGLVMDVLVEPTPTPDGRARLAYHLVRSDLARPIPQREVRFGTHLAPATIQLPKVRVGEIAGARVVPLDEVFDVGEVPGRPSEPPLRIRMRIREAGDVRQPGTAEEAAQDFQAPEVGAEEPDLRALMTGLGRADDPGRRLRVRLVRKRGTREGATWTLAEVDLSTVPVAGVVASDLFQESIVSDYAQEKDAPPGADPRLLPRVFEPVVDTFRTGLTARIVETDGRPAVRVAWRERVAAPPFSTQLPGGPRVTIDLPEAQVLEGVLPLDQPGRAVHLGRLARDRGIDEVYAYATYE